MRQTEKQNREEEQLDKFLLLYFPIGRVPLALLSHFRLPQGDVITTDMLNITLPYSSSPCSLGQLIKNAEHKTKCFADKHPGSRKRSRGFESLSNLDMWLKLVCYDKLLPQLGNALDLLYFSFRGIHKLSHAISISNSALYQSP